MNPFENPPVGRPVPLDAPTPIVEATGPRRGRMALVALLSAGLLGAGVVGVSQFASADRPEIAAAPPTTQADPDGEPAESPAEEPAQEPVDEPAGEPTERPERPDVDGEIVFDFGEGDPIVIDLGEFDGETAERLHECVGFPAIEFGEFGFPPFLGDRGFLDDGFFDDLRERFDDFEGDVGEFGPFGSFEFGDGLEGSVTVMGPDGVSVIDLGEAGSVTITKDDGEVTISTDGDATVAALDEILDGIEFGDVRPGSLGGLDLDELFESFPAFDELPGFEPIDPEVVQSCIDDVLGN